MLCEPWESFTFVDLGCGKGKCLLLAARLPFVKIIGVEFSAKLVDIATKNLAKYRFLKLDAKRIEVLTLDAAVFDFPSDPLVIYCFNSFLDPVMRAALENLRESLHRHARPVFFILMNPVLDPLFSELNNWTTLYFGGDFRIYEAVAPVT